MPQLSAAENILLGKEPTHGLGFVDRGRLEREALQRLEALGVRIDPAGPVSRLGVAEQQMVEVAKALHGDARLLIMDEPTSALTASEIDALFAAIERLTARGVAVVYISHRLEEVERIGTRVTVLRDGRHVATHRVGEVSLGELIRLMANRELKEHYPKRRVARGEELLRVEGLRTGVLGDVTFSLHRGEVVGLAGLLGAGRTELARAITGADPPRAGRVTIKGRERALPGAAGRHPPGHRLPARGPQDAGAGARAVGEGELRPAQRDAAVALRLGGPRGRDERSRRAGSRTCASGRRAWSRMSCSSPAGTSRRSCSASGWPPTWTCSSWTSPRAASTSRPRWRSTRR